ncbi:MAG: ribonuclease HII [Clostridia bacterium]|nr:ribonuclease HII [Clostridia bacterium]MDH7572411.1 ribonuclease HII [Clostridia bacterium]
MPSGEAGWEKERQLWREGYRLIAGVDEVGRGPLAGPVVAAAVIWPPASSLAGLRDSKRLTPRQRQVLDALIRERALAWAVAAVPARYIDTLGLSRAVANAMCRALSRLSVAPEYVLVDGYPVSQIPWPQEALIHGDAFCASIAAAAILAKVWRDSLMENLSRRYPQYGFGLNKGYPTPAHLEALRRYGPCPHHRRSFAPVLAAVGAGGGQPDRGEQGQ